MKHAKQPMRSAVRAIDGGVEIAIPALRQSSLLMVLALWLCGWLPAGLHSLAGLFNASNALDLGTLAFELPWLMVWSLGVLATAYLLLWNTLGVQRVCATQQQLTIVNEVLRLQWRRIYRAQDVRNVRINQPMMLAGSGPLSAPSRIAFDHGARTIQFAAGIDEHEAYRLVDILTASLPRFDFQRNPK